MTRPVLALLLGCLLAGCTSPHVRTVEAFRAALEADDVETARGYLADDPRVWYEARTGAGSPWTLGQGRWSAWDDHFRGRSEPVGPWTVTRDAVSRVFLETNDYYLLTERGPTPYRMTYFFDADGTIEGRMVSAVREPKRVSTSRFDDFEAWALAHDPDELAYLMPGGSIDPTGDRAPRFRALLERWRADAGLPPIE